MTRPLVVLAAVLAISEPAGGSQTIRTPPPVTLPPDPEPDLSAVPEAYRQIILTAALSAGVPVLILAGLARAESDFTPAPAHRDPLDKGMFGIREAPGYREERARLYGEYDAEDPVQAARVAAEILADHMAHFGYMPAAIAAYHRGAGWVELNGIDWEYVDKVWALVEELMRLDVAA